MSFLVLDGVGKRYATPDRWHPVLHDVTLDVPEGEFVSVIGASGSGKTTLVSLVAGLAMPDAGTITLDGAPITGPGLERGVVFQSHSLLPWMTVLENVQLAVDATRPEWSPAARRTRAEHFVHLVGLGDAQRKRPSELSGGMRQRVALARGLATEPRLLLLDEPLSALDALTRATLQRELAHIWWSARRTVLMITNDVDEAILLADRIHILIPTFYGGSTLGPAIGVELLRPRRARELSRSREYQRVRRAIVETLATARRHARVAS
jgi:nitrate/nitrite transport system ATP-binding protein